MENTTPDNIVEFPKKSLLKKSAKVVGVVGVISAGALVALNFREWKTNGNPLMNVDGAPTE